MNEVDMEVAIRNKNVESLSSKSNKGEEQEAMNSSLVVNNNQSRARTALSS